MTKNKQKWEVEIAKEGASPHLIRGRQNKRAWTKQANLPSHVRAYCCVVDEYGKMDAPWSDISEHNPTYRVVGDNARIDIEVDKPAFLSGILPGMERQVKRLEAALKAASEGRNESCWPLHSFGWKDADLEPDGCTGIRKIIGADHRKVVVEVGGHKTVCDPTYESEWDLTDEDAQYYSDMAHGIVCEGPAGEWTGDDWCLHETMNITVNWRGNILATAAAIIKKARKAVRPFEESCKMVDKDMDEVYKEIRKKYEKAS